MSKIISLQAARAREQARAADGKFGAQPHDKADGIELGQADPVQARKQLIEQQSELFRREFPDIHERDRDAFAQRYVDVDEPEEQEALRRRMGRFQDASKRLADTEHLLPGMTRTGLVEGRGPKYDPEERDAAQIAKKVRRDVKDMQAAGAIPEGSVSVRTSRFSMGQSITVHLEMDNELMNAPTEFGGEELSAYGQAIRNRLTWMSEQYNSSSTDYRTDATRTNHYSGASLSPKGT